MKLAKVPVDMILKVIFWICRAYVDWYWKYAEMPHPDDLECWLHPTKADLDRWKEIIEMDKRGEI